MPASPQTLRILVFAEIEGGLWGTLVGDMLGIAGGEVWLDTVRVDPESDGALELAGPRSELSASLIQEGAPREQPAVRERLCRVVGQVELSSGPRSVDAVGALLEWSDGDGGFDTVRVAYACLGSEDALVVAALRPRRAHGHEDDALAAAAFEAGQPLAVVDPRLSTTYDEAGAPMRAGFELWISAAEGEAEYPRRASGEATGEALELDVPGLHAVAHGVRWHSRGAAGGGAYIVGRRR